MGPHPFQFGELSTCDFSDRAPLGATPTHRRHCANTIPVNHCDTPPAIWRQRSIYRRILTTFRYLHDFLTT